MTIHTPNARLIAILRTLFSQEQIRTITVNQTETSCRLSCHDDEGQIIRTCEVFGGYRLTQAEVDQAIAQVTETTFGGCISATARRVVQQGSQIMTRMVNHSGHLVAVVVQTVTDFSNHYQIVIN